MQESAPSSARSNWSAIRSDVAADALRRSGHLRLCVQGESMLPALWPGDSVEIEACSLSDVRPGQILLALRDGRFFLHRLNATVTKNAFILRGDSMPSCDPVFPPEALLGRMVASGEPTSWFAAKCRRAIGWVLCYCRPTRSLALKIHSREKSPAGSPQAAAGVSPWELLT